MRLPFFAQNNVDPQISFDPNLRALRSICYITTSGKLFGAGLGVVENEMSLSQIDVVDTLLAQYAAGSLSKPAKVLVESHLELKPENRRFVSELETIGGLSLEQLVPVDMADNQSALMRIMNSSPDVANDIQKLFPSDDQAINLPQSLRSFIGCDVEDIPWRTKLPGFKEYELGEMDGCHVSMFWIRAGRTMPAHTHDGCELSIVLDGAFTDERGIFGKGDISIADASVDHRPKAHDERPCIGFAVLDERVKLTGSWGQLISDLIG